MGVNDNNVYSFLFSCGRHVSAWHICQAGCVITKTGNDHKQPQPTKNHHKSPANDHKPPENDHKPPPGHPCTSNQKADVLFLLPTRSNYKDHHDFEKHRQLVRGDSPLLSQYLCETNNVGFACFGRLSS